MHIIATDYWVARILEIRALDADNVYARIFWMYSPDELPPNTLSNEDYVSGRQLYHGQHELIASNHSQCTHLLVAAPSYMRSRSHKVSGYHQRRQCCYARHSQPLVGVGR